MLGGKVMRIDDINIDKDKKLLILYERTSAINELENIDINKLGLNINENTFKEKLMKAEAATFRQIEEVSDK